jgi:hypothetical protein
VAKAMKGRARFVGIVALGALACPASAWKPAMHVYLAELAMQDALDDGRVGIYLTPAIGTLGITRDVGFNTPPNLQQLITNARQFPVDPENIAALRSYPAYYRAGTMGPDAYPDIVTGQNIIHADVPSNTPGGTNAWLQHVWNEALKLPPSNRAKQLKARAFALGYLTHGAGDIFAHSYVNHYAGGDFDTSSTNFLRHLTLEGYIARRCPKPATTETSIDGIEDWIYSTLVDARAGTVLSDRLYKGDKVHTSVPYIFSKLRDKLASNIDDYNRHKDDVTRRFSIPLIEYQKRWIQDIDDGLKAWPRFSHDVARHMIFFDADNILERRKSDGLSKIAVDYHNRHLLRMVGLPDVASKVAISVTEMTRFWDTMLYEIISEDQIHMMKASVLDFIALGFTEGRMDFAQLKEHLTGPERYFDQVLSSNNRPKGPSGVPLGHEIKLLELNATLNLTSPADKFNLNNFAPAYNTLLMSKMILLSPAGVTELMTALGKPFRAPAEFNLMLGYVRKFDGTAQWVANNEKMLLQQEGVFNRVFRTHEGFVPTAIEAIPVPRSYQINVQIIRVRALQSDIDIGSEPDFYPRVLIGTRSFVRDAIDNRSDISPNWSFTTTLTPATEDTKIPVRITIFDEDGNLAGADDVCDAAPGNGNAIALSVTPSRGTFTGTASGKSGDQIILSGDQRNRVQVTFRVIVAAL